MVGADSSGQTFSHRPIWGGQGGGVETLSGLFKLKELCCTLS